MRAQDPVKAPGVARPRRPESRVAGAAPNPVALGGAGGTPAAILALQRSVGNAAVTRMLGQTAPGRTEHEHGAGCGHDEPAAPVQRSAVHEVIESRGRSLPDPVRSDAEDRLGVPSGTFRSVSLHDSPRDIQVSRSIGATAFTSGEHVVGDVSRLQTLLHELHHVGQQRRGPVPGTDTGDGLRTSDPNDPAEREAEAVAAHAAALE
ncbi:DUF4157 domain-containing protein [Streptacidiphilus sp. EB129]|uniref:eCIS core domain-containing protein n=1 Tax=Streptacidiphilus sp. EB129 TaxID=3156262 RepID=UPI0035145DB9